MEKLQNIAYILFYIGLAIANIYAFYSFLTRMIWNFMRLSKTSDKLNDTKVYTSDGLTDNDAFDTCVSEKFKKMFLTEGETS